MSLSASRTEGPQGGQKPQIKCSCWVPMLYFNIVVRPRLDTASKIPGMSASCPPQPAEGGGVHVIADGCSRRNGDHLIGRNEDAVSQATGQRQVSRGRSRTCGRLGPCLRGALA